MPQSKLKSMINIQPSTKIKDSQFKPDARFSDNLKVNDEVRKVLANIGNNCPSVWFVQRSNQYYTQLYDLFFKQNVGADAARFSPEDGDNVEFLLVGDRGILIQHIVDGAEEYNADVKVKNVPSLHKQVNHPYSSDQTTTSKHHILVRKKDSIEIIYIENVDHVQAWDKYAYIFTSDGKRHVSFNGLRELEIQHANSSLMRCHKSHLVNIHHIKKISKTNELLLSSGITLPISRRKRSDLIRILEANNDPIKT